LRENEKNHNRLNVIADINILDVVTLVLLTVTDLL
jgi:hypothetical protein